jgi:hypothetical protein
MSISSSSSLASAAGYAGDGGLHGEFSFGQQQGMKNVANPWSPRLQCIDVRQDDEATLQEEGEEEGGEVGTVMEEKEEVDEVMETSMEYAGGYGYKEEEEGEQLSDDDEHWVRGEAVAQDVVLADDVGGDEEKGNIGVAYYEEDGSDAADGLRRVPTEVRRHAEQFAGDMSIRIWCKVQN